MLGGSYTAISDDPTGLYYNPAGLGFVKKNKLSASTTGFYEKATTYDEAINSNNFVRQAKSNFPSFVGNTYRFSFITAGFAIITVDNRNTKQTDYFTDISTLENEANTYSRFQHENNLLQLYGGGVAIKLGPLSLGSSHSYFEYLKESTIHQMVIFNNGLMRTIDQSLKSEAKGVIHKFGAQLRTRRLSIGITASVTSELSDKSEIKQDSTFHETGEDVLFNHAESSLDGLDFRIPNSQSIGVAWKNKSFLITADITHYDEAKHASISTFDYQSTLNYSLGAEMKVSRKFFGRLGIFSNNDLTKKIDPSDATINHLDHIDFVGYSLGFGYQTKAFESSFGYTRQDGSGKSQIVAERLEEQTMSSTSHLFLLNFGYFTK